MTKIPRKTGSRGRLKAPVLPPGRSDFDEVLRLIEAARARAVTAVNTTLIDLYWQIGEHISRRVAADGWGKGTVQELAGYIQSRHPNARGFSASNLWRMMQFSRPTARRQDSQHCRENCPGATIWPSSAGPSGLRNANSICAWLAALGSDGGRLTMTVGGDTAAELRYVRQPFQREPDFGVTSVNYDLPDLLARTEEPA